MFHPKVLKNREVNTSYIYYICITYPTVELEKGHFDFIRKARQKEKEKRESHCVTVRWGDGNYTIQRNK